MQLFCAPLQGFTDFRFRNAFNKHFGGIDAFYAPYIRLNNDKEIKTATLNDLHPENNTGLTVVPQVMTADADEFLYVTERVKQLGYKELNWNLGCPYSMVAKRGMGSGLLARPKIIQTVLEQVCQNSDINISVKLRLGYSNANEIFPVLDILNNYPVKQLIIHPRIGKQMYKGEVDIKCFMKCLKQTNHTVVYNGDIQSLADFQRLTTLLPEINTWMLGRGLIANPFLPKQIRMNSIQLPENSNERFYNFLNDLLAGYSNALSGDKHIIQRMYQFWEYFIGMFPNSVKLLKRIKKAKHMDMYQAAVNNILRSELLPIEKRIF